MSNGTTFSGADAFLKDFYPDGQVEPQFISKTPLASKIQGTSNNLVVDGVGGRQIIFPVRYGMTQGLGARSAGEANPQARSQLADKCQFPVRKLVARVQIEGEAWRASEGAGKKAFVRLLGEETNQCLTGFNVDFNVQAYGDGSGKRATVTTGGVAGQSISIVVDQTLGLFPDMLVDVWSAAGVIKVSGLVISSVDPDTLTVVLQDTGAIAIAATDYFTRNGNASREIQGLESIVADVSGPATFQNLAVATKGYWRALELDNGGTARALTLNLIEQAYLNVQKQDGKNPDLILMDYTQHRKYEQLLISDKRFTDASGRPALDGGYKRLTYNDVVIEADQYCPAGKVYILDTRVMRLWRQTGFVWQLSPDMKNIWKPVEGMDAYEATAYWEGEFGTMRRNKAAKIVDLES